jgi:hypothetical protein
VEESCSLIATCVLVKRVCHNSEEFEYGCVGETGFEQSLKERWMRSGPENETLACKHWGSMSGGVDVGVFAGFARDAKTSMRRERGCMAGTQWRCIGIEGSGLHCHIYTL